MVGEVPDDAFVGLTGLGVAEFFLALSDADEGPGGDIAIGAGAGDDLFVHGDGGAEVAVDGFLLHGRLQVEVEVRLRGEGGGEEEEKQALHGSMVPGDCCDSVRRLWSVDVETVAEAAHGDDEARVGRVGFDFATEFDDVGVDDAVGDVGVGAPDEFDEAVAGEDFAGVLEEGFEETEFEGGHLDGRAEAAEFGFGGVEFAVAEFEDGSRSGGGGAAEEGLDAGAEFAITQLFFRVDDYERLVQMAQAAGCTMPMMRWVLMALSIMAR